jgi:hypothetical protein
LAFNTPNITQPIRAGEKSSDNNAFINPEPPGMGIDDEKTPAKKVESLDSFLAKNTSEDNVSFEAIIKESEKKEQAKLHQAWLHEKEKLLKLVNTRIFFLELLKINICQKIVK